MTYTTYTDRELVRLVDADPSASLLERELARRLARAEPAHELADAYVRLAQDNSIYDIAGMEQALLVASRAAAIVHELRDGGLLDEIQALVRGIPD